MFIVAERVPGLLALLFTSVPKGTWEEKAHSSFLFSIAHFLDALPEKSDVKLVNQNFGSNSYSLRWKGQF